MHEYYIKVLYINCTLGWKPRRTIIFAHWDGEEQAVAGSYEWVQVIIVLIKGLRNKTC